MQCCTCDEYSAAVVHEAEARHSGHSSNYTTQTQGQVTSQPRPGLHDVMPIQLGDQHPCIRGGGGAPWQLAGGHLQPTLVTATLYTGGVPVWPLESLVLVSLVTACGHCGGVGWSAVGAGLGCWHQPAAALPPASPETQPGRLLRAGGGTPWHSGQHTTGCNTRHHTTPPHSCLAPGSWLLAHQPQHRSLQRGCRVSCTVAVWTHGMGQSRVRGCRVPNCRGAAKQWSPLASQAAAAHSSGQHGQDQCGESVGGEQRAPAAPHQLQLQLPGQLGARLAVVAGLLLVAAVSAARRRGC